LNVKKSENVCLNRELFSRSATLARGVGRLEGIVNINAAGTGKGKYLNNNY